MFCVCHVGGSVLLLLVRLKSGTSAKGRGFFGLVVGFAWV